MISYDIIVHKPAQVIPLGFAPNRHVPVTQEELDKQVDHHGFQVGDFITMAPYNMCGSLYNVHCIMYIEKRLAGCRYIQGKPAAYLLCQVESAATQPWVRFDTPNDYRLLTEQEYNKLIGENSDNLRHNCHEKSKFLIPTQDGQGGSPV